MARVNDPGAGGGSDDSGTDTQTDDPLSDGTTGSEAVAEGGDETRGGATGSSSGSTDNTATPGQNDSGGNPTFSQPGSDAGDDAGDDDDDGGGGGSGSEDPLDDGTTGSEAIESGGDSTRSGATGSSSGSTDNTTTPGQNDSGGSSTGTTAGRDDQSASERLLTDTDPNRQGANANPERFEDDTEVEAPRDTFRGPVNAVTSEELVRQQLRGRLRDRLGPAADEFGIRRTDRGTFEVVRDTGEERAGDNAVSTDAIPVLNEFIREDTVEEATEGLLSGYRETVTTPASRTASNAVGSVTGRGSITADAAGTFVGAAASLPTLPIAGARAVDEVVEAGGTIADAATDDDATVRGRAEQVAGVAAERAGDAVGRRIEVDEEVDTSSPQATANQVVDEVLGRATGNRYGDSDIEGELVRVRPEQRGNLAGEVAFGFATAPVGGAAVRGARTLAPDASDVSGRARAAASQTRRSLPDAEIRRFLDDTRGQQQIGRQRQRSGSTGSSRSTGRQRERRDPNADFEGVTGEDPTGSSGTRGRAVGQRGTARDARTRQDDPRTLDREQEFAERARAIREVERDTPDDDLRRVAELRDRLLNEGETVEDLSRTELARLRKAAEEATGGGATAEAALDETTDAPGDIGPGETRSGELFGRQYDDGADTDAIDRVLGSGQVSAEMAEQLEQVRERYVERDERATDPAVSQEEVTEPEATSTPDEQAPTSDSATEAPPREEPAPSIEDDIPTGTPAPAPPDERLDETPATDTPTDPDPTGGPGGLDYDPDPDPDPDAPPRTPPTPRPQLPPMGVDFATGDEFESFGEETFETFGDAGDLLGEPDRSDLGVGFAGLDDDPDGFDPADLTGEPSGFEPFGGDDDDEDLFGFGDDEDDLVDRLF